MPHLGQASRGKSTNFLTQKKVLQRHFVTFTASLKGQMNKFLCTQESPAEKFYVTFRASLKGQINKFVYTQESCVVKYSVTFHDFSLHFSLMLIWAAKKMQKDFV